MDKPLPESALLAQCFAMCAHRNQPGKFEDAPEEFGDAMTDCP